MCIVRLLLSWYRQQTMQVKWGSNYSSPFTVTNGVRQGRVLSPYLFAVYLNELSIQLGSARVGCSVRNMVVNHLLFADDICVFSPSISGLQCLLNIYGDYAAEHEIIFNCKKTTGVLFCPKKYKQPMTKTYDKVSVSSRNLSQVSVSEVTVSTTSLFCYWRKKIFRPIRVIDLFGTNEVYTLNQWSNIPPHALLQWRSDVNVAQGRAQQCFLFLLLTFAYNNIKWETIMYHAYYNNKE